MESADLQQISPKSTIKNKISLLVRKLFATSFTIMLATVAFANPNLNSVTSGNVTVNQSGNTTTVNQTSQQAIIQWNSFNIAAQEKTQFIQPNSSSVALNRINPNQGASQIYGRLTSNGQIILINGAGIFFGPSAQVNVGGLIASTSDISNENFLAGKYIFNIHSQFNGSIENEGKIIAAKYGLVALLGDSVSNTGVISARLGSIAIGSGSEFTLDFYGDQLINFSVDAPSSTASTGVVNSGKLLADGGKVLITAQAAAGVLDNVIDMAGVAETRSVSEQDGEIILSGGDNGTVDVSGSLTATGDKSGQTGGTVKVLGNNVVLASTANINVSGDAGGGTIDVGGDAHGSGPDQDAGTATVNAGSILNASGITSGNGGNVVVWSNDNTQFAGSILAQGGAQGGNGGYVETSGGYLAIGNNASVNTLAPNGTTGTWLLDPSNITISTSADSSDSNIGGIYYPSSGAATSNILNTELETALNSSSVTVTTSNTGTAGSSAGTLTVNAPIIWTGTTTLTLSAASTLTITSGDEISSTNGSLTLTTTASAAAVNIAAPITLDMGTLTLNVDGGTISDTAAVNVYNFALQQGVWNQNTATLPAFNVANNFSIADSGSAYLGTFTRVEAGTGASGSPYQIADVYGLQGLGTLSNTAYAALENDINATVTQNWNSGLGFIPFDGIYTTTAFRGNFQGNNYAIANLYINEPSSSNVGLFGDISNATIAKVGLINPNVTGQSDVGALVGGTGATSNNITNSYVSGGTVTGTSGGSGYIGGLVGASNANISNSYSSAAVNAAAGENYVGGLVGYNAVGYTISNSYSTGAVTAASNTSVLDIGGFVGLNAGTITDTYSTGFVYAYEYGYIRIGGGFAGGNTGTITYSFNDSTTSGSGTPIASGTNSGVTDGCMTGTCPFQGTGSSYDNLSTQSTYTTAGTGGGSSWTFATTPTSGGNWYMIPGSTRPILEMEYGNTSGTVTVNTGHQLQLIAQAPAASYVLGTNADLSGTSNAADVWGAAGFIPIGTGPAPFSGSFSGLGNTINNLFMNSGNAYVGLFGAISGATLSNFGVTNANVIANSNSSSRSGIVLGADTNSTVSNIYSTGSINGSYSGGLIGYLNNGGGTLTNSYSTAAVTATLDAGGLIADMLSGAVSNSYFTGSVTSSGNNYSTGGIAGYMSGGSLTNVYSTGSISSTNSSESNAPVGGLVGDLVGGATITTSYSQSPVITAVANSQAGALVGNIANSGSSITKSYYDTTDTSRAAIGTTGTGTTTTSLTGLTDTQFYNGTNFSNFNFYNTANSAATNATAGDVWAMAGYPHLSMENTSTITNIVQLQLIEVNPSGSYTLANNIDATGTPSWNIGTGFIPIGTSAINFTGNFNGAGNTVNGLYINETGTTGVGLFGYVGGSSTIQNVGVTNANITGKSVVGILAGDVDSNTVLVNNVYATGTVGDNTNTGYQAVGGLIGDLSGLLSDSYADANVSHNGDGGGLVGDNYGQINNSYALGSMAGYNTSVGGLVGFNQGYVLNSFAAVNVIPGANTGGNNLGALVGFTNGGLNVNNYFDENSSSIYGSTTGITGDTTTTLQSALPSGFSSSVWGITAGSSYPYLLSFGTPSVVSGYIPGGSSGVTTLGAATVSMVNGGNLMSTAFSGADGYYYEQVPSGSLGTGTIFSLALSGATSSANIIDYVTGSNMTGLNLTANTIQIGDSNSNLYSNSAVGSITGSGILFSASGNNITVNSGDSLSTTATTTFKLSGNIVNSGTGNIQFNGPVNLTNSDTVSTASGTLGFASTISGSAYTLTLSSSGGSTIAGTTSPASLVITGGGTISGVLGGATTTLVVNSGSLSITNASNTYGGGTTLNTNAGLYVGASGSLGTGAITFNNGALAATSNGISLSNNYSVTVNDTAIIGGSYNITLSGAGTINGNLVEF
jgi:filamentous hemagglutinin family protein